LASEHRLLTHLGDVVLDLRARLVVRLLDPGRVDPAILEQLLDVSRCDLGV